MQLAYPTPSCWHMLGSLPLTWMPQENIHRNFGMPQPNGYRKALRFMRHADKFGFPIITFVDTPGAYAGKNAEELGQVGSGAVVLVQRLSSGCAA